MQLAILQARYSSSRLPGKVLKPILDKPMLYRQMERIQRARLIDKIVIATSTAESDDQVESFCLENGFLCERGSLNDVLDRYYQIARACLPRHIIRLTGDCPLADAGIIDRVIYAHLLSGADYTSNTIEPTYPDGLDAEIFTYSALESAWINARLPSEREHVTPYIYKHPEIFTLRSCQYDVDLSHLRWTVDEPEDYQFVTEVYKSLYRTSPEFSWLDVLNLLQDRPHLTEINRSFERNEGLKKSMLLDGQEASK